MAHHLLGMKGPDEIPWRETAARVRSASCRSIADGTVRHAGAALVIEGAHAMGPIGDLKDIAILPLLAQDGDLRGPRAPALKLARDPPKPGERVWLIAQLSDPSRADEHVHGATVVPAVGCLAYVYDDRSMDLSNTSGAPVVNAGGEVVGVNVAVAHHDGIAIGIADDLATVRIALSSDAPP